MTAKYHEGNKVIYLDADGLEKTGTVSAVVPTDVHEWNQESKPLYMISSSPYLRGEGDIIKLCV